MSTQAHPGWSARSGLYFVLLFGTVNLFADMTYEGARSVTGPFLGVLGANGFVVGAVAGFGEFLGYALRLVSGRWADRSRLYWPITLGGYVVQMVSVPALALSGSWVGAAVLILLERIGRATRNPPRDVMLSHAAKQVGGYGWAFGLHEALDQTGALVGPIAIAVVLASGSLTFGNYQMAFFYLAIPAAIMLALLAVARFTYPHPESMEQGPTEPDTGGLPTSFGSISWLPSWSAQGWADGL